MLETITVLTHGKLHYGIARQYKWFLHHVLTVNQRLTNLPSNPVCDTCRLQTCRLADLQTCRLADLQTCRLADLQICRLVDLESQHTSSPYPKSFLNSAQSPLRIMCLPEFPRFRSKQTQRKNGVARFCVALKSESTDVWLTL